MIQTVNRRKIAFITAAGASGRFITCYNRQNDDDWISDADRTSCTIHRQITRRWLCILLWKIHYCMKFQKLGTESVIGVRYVMSASW